MVAAQQIKGLNQDAMIFFHRHSAREAEYDFRPRVTGGYGKKGIQIDTVLDT